MPTPAPWIVRAEPAADVAPRAVTEDGVAGDEQAGGFCLIGAESLHALGETDLPIALGIQRLADATLMAGAPDLAAALLALLTSPDLLRRDLDPLTRAAVAAAWHLLVRVAPHLQI